MPRAGFGSRLLPVCDIPYLQMTPSVALSPLRFQLLEMLIFDWTFVPTKGPLNLLLNPDATENFAHWIPLGDAIVESAAGHDSCFSLRNFSFFRQDVILPPEAEGKYAVLLGLASSERINPGEALTGMPSLYGYMMSDPYHIVDYLQFQRMQGSGRVPNEWSPVHGIFMVPPGATRIRFILMPQEGSAARFDDLGLYLLPTMPEAMRFVQGHFKPEQK